MELVAENLGLERGGRMLVSGLSFRLSAGSLTRLTGANGAGKTSLLRLIAGLAEPAHGTIRLVGGDEELGIGAQAHFVAHQEAVKPALSMRENLEFWRDFLGGDGMEAALDAFGLRPLAELPAAWASAGQKRRLGLARLALAQRPLWLLDEPTVGLDAASEAGLTHLMRAHLDKGGIILAATHVPLQIDCAELRRGGVA